MPQLGFPFLRYFRKKSGLAGSQISMAALFRPTCMLESKPRCSSPERLIGLMSRQPGGAQLRSFKEQSLLTRAELLL